MDHSGIGAPSHIADEPGHLAPILSERAGQVKPEPRGSERRGHEAQSDRADSLAPTGFARRWPSSGCDAGPMGACGSS
jgi:hypothetical protein